MKRLILSLTACFFTATLIAEVPLTGWAQLDDRCALRIVNRLDYTIDNFSGKAPGKTDDRVVLDFMDFSGIPLEINSITIIINKNKSEFPECFR